MKYTVNGLRNLSKERAERTRPLYAELGSVLRDDSKETAYRQRRERELRAQVANVNSTYEVRIKEAAMEAMEEPQRQLAAGTPWKPEQVAEAQLVAQQYAGRPPRHLVDAIAQALNAGDTTGARIKARAAEALNVQLGSLGAQVMMADPIKKGAHDSITAIEGLAQLALAEPLRELAAAGLASPRERLYLKAFAHDRSLRPDAPFTDQVEPGYSGPDVKRDGTPANPFPEPHNPKLDRQRQRAEHLREGTRMDEWAERQRGAAAGGPGDDSDGSEPTE